MDAQIVTGHADGRTHVWKVKNSENSWSDAKIEVVQTFAPFNRIVPAVKFTNAEDKSAPAVAFVAASQDGQLKVFDARAKVARAACSAEEGVRLLCLNWSCNEVGKVVYSGGSDGKLRRHVFPEQS